MSARAALDKEGFLLEHLSEDAGFFYRGGKLLEQGRSEWQDYEVWETPLFGRLFRLDGCFMTSERDEFYYHENLIQVPAMAHEGVRRALIIGGGDGGSAEELLKSPTMERVVIAELDEKVIDISRRYFAAVHHGALDDARVDIRIGDGMKYVNEDGPAAGDRYDLIVLNFANPDMVGHTGVEAAAIKAVEAVDECVGKAVDALKEVDGQMFICADHGNAEQLIDEETGEPFTAHTTNQVPFILVNADPSYKLREGGCLADIAPTLIEMMGMEQPKEMTGKSLIVK